MALDLKNKGNKALVAGNFQEAYDCYTKAIELDDTNAIFFANRAQCSIKLEQFGTAIVDAGKAIELDPNYVKSYYRRATALVGTLQYQKALQDYRSVVAKAPGDAGARAKLDECAKIIRIQAFQRAIEVEDEPSVFASLNFEHTKDDDELGPLDIEKIDMEFVRKMVATFKAGKLISRKKVYQIIKGALDLFLKEPTMNELPAPQGKELITVCGDTHGQFFDFLNIFDSNGWPSSSHTYLFNGDFVDRGSWSTEIALTLYAMKLALPHNMYMNRGNHESDTMNITYGFSGECKAKYSSDLVFKAFSESFSALPLAALIGEQYLVLHGGLFSNDKVGLEDIRKLNRFAQKQPGQDGLMMEMLWTDPQEEPGRGPSKRGVGLQFGPDITKRFCQENNLKAVIRSHEVRDGGYSEEHGGQLVTIFSAPNYCDQAGNKGAYINIGSDMKLQYTQFDAVEHPNVPPMAYASNLMR